MNKQIYFYTLLLMLFASGVSLKAQVIRPFSATDLNNNLIEYQDLKGEKLTVYDFWASWCKPCLKAMPKLDKIYEEFKSKGVNVIGVNVDGPRSFSKALPLVKSLGLKYPVVGDIDGNIKDDFEVGSLPTFIIVNSKNKIVYRHEGFASGDEEEWKHKIEKFLEK